MPNSNKSRARIVLSSILTNTGSLSVVVTTSLNQAYTCQSYLDLVTNEHRKTKFLKFVETGACPFAELSNTLDKAILAFDVDTAEGDQLDIIGEWVGAERVLAIDTEASALFFSFDVDGSGWDYAIWYEDFDNNLGLKAVPDKVYRLMVKAKIMANMWNGTCEQANAMWKEVFNGSTIYFLDGFDMTMGVYVSGISLDSIIFELITQGYLAVKPEGVRIDYYIIGPEDPTAKTFAWGTETDIVGGWGVGYWSTKVPVIE